MARRQQQNIYETFSDWNLYKENEYRYLKDFIGYAMYGPPPNLYENDMNVGNFSYDKNQTVVISKVYQKVVEFGVMDQKGKSIQCGLIYNIIFNADAKAKTTDNSKIVVFPVPVFKVRGWRVQKEKKRESRDIWYIDNCGRVYKDFLDYIKNNTLPQCTMVVPKNGIYQSNPSNFDIDPRDLEKEHITSVWIEVYQSPASCISRKLLNGGDALSTVSGLAGTAIGVAALFTPIGGAVALAGTIGFGVSSLWTATRCSQNLIDRKQHEESLTDKSSVGSWIGIAGSAFGLGAASGPFLMARAVRAGITISRAATVTYDTVLIGSLVINGIGAGFKGCDLVMSCINGEDVSKQEVALLVVHIFFLCNSVVNLKLAKNLVETTQGQVLKDYEASLRSNRHRKEFQRMARNTRAAGSDPVSSNEEIIRGINQINDKDQFFQAMVRNRKSLSSSNARATFSEGKVKVNSYAVIDPIEFSNLPKTERIEIIKNISSVAPTPSASVNSASTSATQAPCSQSSISQGFRTLREFCSTHSNAALRSVDIFNFTKVLGDLQNVPNGMDILKPLFETAHKILEALPSNSTVGDVFAAIVQFVWDYVKNSIFRRSLPLRIENPILQQFILSMIRKIHLAIERKVEVWVEDFLMWLKQEFPDLMNTQFLLA